MVRGLLPINMRWAIVRKGSVFLSSARKARLTTGEHICPAQGTTAAKINVTTAQMTTVLHCTL
jgi:hypothetical protein